MQIFIGYFLFCGILLRQFEVNLRTVNIRPDHFDHERVSEREAFPVIADESEVLLVVLPVFALLPYFGNTYESFAS